MTFKLPVKEQKTADYINRTLTTFPIAAWQYPKVCLAVLKERSISYADKVFDNLMQISAQGVPQINLNYSRTDLARNKIAQYFLRTSFSHVIMLDIDHKHPIDIVQKLSRWFILDKLEGKGELQIVGGLNFRRSDPHDPCCHLFGKGGKIYAPAQWEEGLLQVAAIGTGSIMISREVFEEIQPPWFFNKYESVWDDVWPGEDMGFSMKAREYGFKMFVDTTLTSPHIGEYEIAEPQFRKAMEKRGAEIVKSEGIEFTYEK